MKWGITCFFENRKDFELVIDMAPRYPLKYLEIRGERPFFSPDDLQKEDVKFFQDVIQAAGLKITLHATFFDVNLSTFNSYLRKAVMDCYRKYLDLGEMIQAEIMVVHAGQIHRDAATCVGLLNLARNNLIENLIELGDYGEKRGIKIGLENSPPNPHRLMVYDWQSHVDILRAVNHKNVGAVLDMAHAFLHGLSLQKYYEEIKKYLIEIHAHNNDGQTDLHQSMQRGKIDYSGFFKTNRVNVPVIMEIRNIKEARESLEWIKQFDHV